MATKAPWATKTPAVPPAMPANLPPHKLLSAPKGIEIFDWRITVIKSHIVKAADADRISKELDLHLPDMLFAENELRVERTDGFSISFNAVNALRMVDNKRDTFKVSYAEEWAKSRKGGPTEDIKEVKPFDWTFTTLYSGTLGPKNEEPQEADLQIDIERLKRPDPILFYEEISLFEDEMADNGDTNLIVRVRVMPSCLFILMRYFLRVDKMLFRIIDTRVYHEFGTPFVLREQTVREDLAQNVEKKLRPDADPSVLTNVQWIYDNLPIKSSVTHKLATKTT